MNSTPPPPGSTSRAAAPIVVGLGELLWDCFGDTRRPGGAPANVAFIAQQLGLRGTVCSRVGQDAWGDELLEFLRDHQLATDWVQRDPQHKTGWVTVDLSEPQNPQYVIHEPVAWDHLQFDEPTATLMRSASAICFGTLAQRNEQSRMAIHRCLEAAGPTCLRVYDVNLRKPWYERAWIERSLRAATIVKLSEEEVGRLAAILELGQDEPRAFAAYLQQNFDVQQTCITRGARGCLLIDGEGSTDQPGLKIAAADPVGAGDAFTSALIYAHLQGWSRDAAARFANRVAALVASKPGAMPDISVELQQLFAEA